MPKIYEFAVKKDILNSGKELLTPVCRINPKWGWLNSTPWCRIVELYDRFILLDLDWVPEMTFEECDKHIKGYMDVLKKQVENNIADEIYYNKENKEI